MGVLLPSLMALDAISDTAIRRITKILYLDSTKYWGDGAKKWLREQEEKVRKITNTELLRPDSKLSRVAIKLSLHHQAARLCSAHKKLDSRVIRSLLWNIAYESAARANKYRVLRIKGRLEVNLKRNYSMNEEELKELENLEKDSNDKLNKWLDWTNAISALWLGESEYRELCSSAKRDFLPDCVKSKCEACMLATVGGCIPYLTALRASLLARQMYKAEKSKGKKASPPLLLRVIDSWISSTERETRESINNYSDELVPLLVNMRVLARRLEDEQMGRRKRKGAFPLQAWGAEMSTWTKDGLPVPLPDRPRQRPVRKDTISWTTDRAQTSREAASEDSCSAMMGDGIQTDLEFGDEEVGGEEEISGGYGYDGTDDRDAFEYKDEGNEEAPLSGIGFDGTDDRAMFRIEEAASEKRLSSAREDSHNRIDWAQEVRRVDVNSTNTLVSLYDCYRRLPEDQDLSTNPQTSGRVSPLTIDPQMSTSSWTSGVVDDNADIYGDDRLAAEIQVMPCGDNNDAMKSGDDKDDEVELATRTQREDVGEAIPEASSVYSCDERDEGGNHNEDDNNKDAVESAASMVNPFVEKSAASPMLNPFDVGLGPPSCNERESTVPAPLEPIIDVKANKMNEAKETAEKEDEGESSEKKEENETNEIKVKEADDEENRRREKLRNNALAMLEGRIEKRRRREEGKKSGVRFQRHWKTEERIRRRAKLWQSRRAVTGLRRVLSQWDGVGQRNDDDAC